MMFMEQQMRKYPVGIQTFSEIRANADRVGSEKELIWHTMLR